MQEQLRGRHSRPHGLAWAVLCASLMLPQTAWSCSVCQCGDYTVTLLGTEKSYAGRWRVATEWLTRDETQSDRHTEEWRLNFSSSYAVSDRLSLAMRLPLVDKQFSDPNLTGQSARGFGDLDLTARYVLSDQTIPARWVYGWQGGLRIPTGETVRTADGQLVDIDAQPGTGALIPAIGGFIGHFQFPWMSYLTAQVSPQSKGDQGFEPAAHAVLTWTQQYAPSQRWAAQLALESRWAGRNRYDGVTDPNSGGLVSYLTPGLAWRMGAELLVGVAAQLPLIEALNGNQDETGEIRMQLTYDLPN